MIKAKLYGGYILPINIHEKMDYIPSAGVEMNFEMLPTGDNAWEQHWAFPTIGVGLVGVNLGNQETLGQMFAIYPYALWHFAKTQKFEFGVKLGFGVAGTTKKNIANGSYVSGYVSTGIDAQFNLRNDYAVAVELGTNHLNNCDIKFPNSTMNIVYMTVGMRHRFGRYYRTPHARHANGLPYTMMVNITASGGGKAAYFVDNHTAFCGSFHTDALWKITNCYALGIGADAFYNSTFVRQGTNGDKSYTDKITHSQYFIENDNMSNKFRVGIAINNLFTMGRIGVIFDWGIYLYDPIRNAYPNEGTTARRRNFFYPYNPNKEDGWNYFRAGMRCRLYDNLYTQVSIKTHLYRIEFAEIGIGYSIPMRENVHMNRRTRKFNKIEVWHPDR